MLNPRPLVEYSPWKWRKGIGAFHDAVGGDLDIGGFEVAMDDALLVRCVERIGDLPRDAQRLADRDRRV